MSVIKRFLGEHADLDTVRRCELLGRNSLENPEDEYDEIERVYLLPATYKSFTNTFAKSGECHMVHSLCLDCTLMLIGPQIIPQYQHTVHAFELFTCTNGSF